MTSRFAGMKKTAVVKGVETVAATETERSTRPKSRVGKKAVVGYFSADLSRTLAQMALDRSTSIQALLGEAIDELLRKHGKHPFGER
jgi:hypothetical protein